MKKSVKIAIVFLIIITATTTLIIQLNTLNDNSSSDEIISDEQRNKDDYKLENGLYYLNGDTSAKYYFTINDETIAVNGDLDSFIADQELLYDEDNDSVAEINAPKRTDEQVAMRIGITYTQLKEELQKGLRLEIDSYGESESPILVFAYDNDRKILGGYYYISNTEFDDNYNRFILVK